MPLPRLVSNVLFWSGVENFQLKNEKKDDGSYSEGVLNMKLNLLVAQWAQFIEHDLSKSVARSTSNTLLFPFVK